MYIHDVEAGTFEEAPDKDGSLAARLNALRNEENKFINNLLKSYGIKSDILNYEKSSGSYSDDKKQISKMNEDLNYLPFMNTDGVTNLTRDPQKSFQSFLFTSPTHSAFQKEHQSKTENQQSIIVPSIKHTQSHYFARSPIGTTYSPSNPTIKTTNVYYQPVPQRINIRPSENVIYVSPLVIPKQNDASSIDGNGNQIEYDNISYHDYGRRQQQQQITPFKSQFQIVNYSTIIHGVAPHHTKTSFVHSQHQPLFSSSQQQQQFLPQQQSTLQEYKISSIFAQPQLSFPLNPLSENRNPQLFQSSHQQYLHMPQRNHRYIDYNALHLALQYQRRFRGNTQQKTSPS